MANPGRCCAGFVHGIVGYWNGLQTQTNARQYIEKLNLVEINLYQQKRKKHA